MEADFQELVYMDYARTFVPVDKIVEYNKEVILQRVEDKTRLEAGEDANCVDD